MKFTVQDVDKNFEAAEIETDWPELAAECWFANLCATDRAIEKCLPIRVGVSSQWQRKILVIEGEYRLELSAYIEEETETYARPAQAACTGACSGG